MAITLEAINLIIPLKSINYTYPGGFDLFIRQNLIKFSENYCHDAVLFRAGAADIYEIESMVSYWLERGLIPYGGTTTSKFWKDMCVITSPPPELTLPCAWAEIDAENNCVSLKGSPKGRIIGLDEMKQYYTL